MAELEKILNLDAEDFLLPVLFNQEMRNYSVDKMFIEKYVTKAIGKLRGYMPVSKEKISTNFFNMDNGAFDYNQFLEEISQSPCFEVGYNKNNELSVQLSVGCVRETYFAPVYNAAITSCDANQTYYKALLSTFNKKEDSRQTILQHIEKFAGNYLEEKEVFGVSDSYKTQGRFKDLREFLPQHDQDAQSYKDMPRKVYNQAVLIYEDATKGMSEDDRINKLVSDNITWRHNSYAKQPDNDNGQGFCDEY